MKEIIYLQIGELSNFTGSHFWNTQEAYLSEGQESSSVDWSVSLSEHQSSTQSEPTLCPRVLVFDRKSNFGTLSTANSLGQIMDDEPLGSAHWDGGVIEIRQPHIEESSFHASSLTGEDGRPPVQAVVRYWSDYAKLYLLPRSLHQLPDHPTRETAQSSWTASQNEYNVFNENHDVLEDSFRLLAEDCDSLQGVQFMNDTKTYAGFTARFLSNFRDEHPKLPSFGFPSGWQSASMNLSAESLSAKDYDIFLNQAMYLRSLYEHSTMSISVTQSAEWPEEARDVFSEASTSSNVRVQLHTLILDAQVTRAIPSTFHQLSFLPILNRLPFHFDHSTKSSLYDMGSMADMLKSLEPLPFGCLKGTFPLPLGQPLSPTARPLANLSYHAPGSKTLDPWAEFTVFRGIPAAAGETLPFLHSRTLRRMVYSPPFPLSDTFPELDASTRVPLARAPKHEKTAMISSLSISIETCEMIKQYASTLDHLVRRRSSIGAAKDISWDDLRELSSELWGIYDNFAGGQQL